MVLGTSGEQIMYHFFSMVILGGEQCFFFSRTTTRQLKEGRKEGREEGNNVI